MSDPDSSRFERLPAVEAERTVADRPTRAAVLAFFEDRFGIPVGVFDDYTFWEKGRGSVWAVAGTEPDPIAVETLGMRTLRTGGRHWKPTTNAIQRFGDDVTRNVIQLNRVAARRFVAGDDQAIEWNGDWGYLIAATEIGGTLAPLGVGLYIDGELSSTVPKARQIDLP